MADRQRLRLAECALPADVRAGVSIADSRAHHYGDFNLATHTGDQLDRVQHHRTHFRQLIGARQVQWLQQVHGVDCIEASWSSIAQAPQADAVWTACRGLALAIMTADCVPVLLWHKSAAFIAAAHAGWQGLLNGTLQQLLAAVPGAPEELQAWIGPAISQPCYEVGADVWQQFISAYPQRLRPAAAAPHKRLLDLAGVAEDILSHAGVAAVHHSGWCSYRDPQFYSHRRASHAGQPATGRMASYIMLADA